MSRKFGWDLPPGVSNHMIEEQAGAFEKESIDGKARQPWSLRITPIPIMDSIKKTIKDEGFKIEVYENKPHAPNYNLPTEMNKPEVYYAVNVDELFELLTAIYKHEYTW